MREADEENVIRYSKIQENKLQIVWSASEFLNENLLAELNYKNALH